MSKAIEQIRSINLSELPEPFRVNAYTIITNLKLFVEATICTYENTRSVFDKEVQFEHLQEFYNAVKEYKKNPDKYISANIDIPKIESEILEEKVIKPKPEKEKRKSNSKAPITAKPIVQKNSKGKGMSLFQ
jgi:hypothetical protein